MQAINDTINQTREIKIKIILQTNYVELCINVTCV